MAIFAFGGDACADGLLIAPAWGVFVYFGFDFRKICPKLEQFFVKGIALFCRRDRVVSHNNKPVGAPVFTFCPPGENPIILAPALREFPVAYDV